MLLTAYRAAGLLVNMLKDNIEMDSKEMALVIARSENNLINIYCYGHYHHPRYLVQTTNIFTI